MNIKDKLALYFGNSLREAFLASDDKYFINCEEIRIRLGRKVTVRSDKREYYLKGGYTAQKKDIKDIIELISDYSPYSFENSIKNGFITLQGGFRVGFGGTAVIENSEIKTLKYINSINIRICREVKGCAAQVIGYILGNDIKNTIIFSPPGCGKTTLLRDITRNISNGGINVSVADERFELSGMHNGVSENDLGSHTDVYAGCSKADAIIMLIRAMSPKVICVDEIWGENDVKALETAAASGVKVICTAHLGSISDLEKREDIRRIRNIFDIGILLGRSKGVGSIENIYDFKNYK